MDGPRRRIRFFLRGLENAASAWVVAALSGAFLTLIVLLVSGPVAKMRRFERSWYRERIRYAVEEIGLRALASGTLDRLPDVRMTQGVLSPWPGREVRVSRVETGEGPALRFLLSTPFGVETWLATFRRGLLPAGFQWALGEGDPDPSADFEGGRVVVAGKIGRFRTDEGDGFRHPLDLPGAWEVKPDTVLDMRRCVERGGRRLEVPIRPAGETALRCLPRGTDLDDFAFGRFPGETFVAFPPEGPRVLKVLGHLWIGEPGKVFRVDPGGRDLVFFVRGNLYLRGDLRVRPGRGRLWFLVGAPSGKGFRDLDRDGLPDPGEVLSGGGERPTPREGSGMVYLGLSGYRPRIRAGIVARGDAISGPAGFELDGVLLVGGRLVVPQDVTGRVVIGTLEGRQGEACRGLPRIPGSLRILRLQEVRRLESDAVFPDGERRGALH